MKIHHLKLINFRNYEKVNLDFSPSCNIIYGKNGSGKTNLVESIYVLALTKSFRGTVDKVLFMNNKDFTRIDGTIEDDGFNDYSIIINNVGKKVKINNNNIDKLSDYISKISVILFHPDDLRMIKDTPSTRRKNLNLDISQINNNYLKYLNNYNKVLKQRNMYLKSMYFNNNKSNEYLSVLTDKMVDYGLKLYKMRYKFLRLIDQEINSIYKDITGIDSLSVEYKSDYNDLDKEQVIDKYNQLLEKDKLFGKTTFGIHHDDVVFKFDNQLLKDYGSEGQQKNAVIAYKFALIKIFNNIRNTYPILILDDLFSELDTEKINNILKYLSPDIQTFITTTEVDKISRKIINKSKLIFVEKGDIREVTK